MSRTKLTAKQINRIKKKFTWERLKNIPLQKNPLTVILPSRKTDKGMARVILEFGDEYGWNFNSFSITLKGDMVGGYAKKEIFKYWPEIYHLTRWHLVSSDGLLYDTDTIVSFAKKGDLQFTREAAALPYARLDQLRSKTWVEEQIPDIMFEFASTMRQIFGKLSKEFDF
jgi:hypothetical protein